MSRDFRPLFLVLQNQLYRAPNKQAKQFREMFRLRKDIREKKCVSIVVDYADLTGKLFYF